MQEITRKVINDFASQPRQLQYQCLLTTFKSCFLTLGSFTRAHEQEWFNWYIARGSRGVGSLARMRRMTLAF